MKNLFKKILFLITIVSVAFAVCGCGGGNTVPADEYSEYYHITQVQIGNTVRTGDELAPLGYKNSYIRYKDEASGTLVHFSYQFDFTIDGERIIADGLDMTVEKSDTGVVIHNGDVVMTYEKGDKPAEQPSVQPEAGIYALDLIHHDNVVKDRNRINVEKDNAGSYIELYGDGTGTAFYPDGQFSVTLTENQIMFGDDGINYQYVDGMLILYFDPYSVNTYAPSEEYPSRILVPGLYEINTITEDGTVYRMDTLDSIGLGNTSLYIASGNDGIFYYGEVSLDFNVLGSVLAFEGFNTLYSFAGDKLTTEINGMTFEFIYAGL